MKSTGCVLAIVLLGYGCASNPPNTTPDVWSYTSKDGHGVSLQKFKEAALSLAPGQRSDDVVKLVGLPDTTSAEVNGSKTDHPWFSQTWNYRFPGAELSCQRCELTFMQMSDSSLKLVSWHWYDY